LNKKNYNALSQKFHILSYYDEHGTMVLYDYSVSLTQNTTITNSGVKFTPTFFNDNIWKRLYIIAIYKPPKMQVSHINSILKKIIKKSLHIV
jgi:hypothetical protein